MALDYLIQISENYNTTKYTIKYQSGTFKEVKNYNKIIDTLEFESVTLELNQTLFKNVYKEGSFIWLNGELRYIVDRIKKVKQGKKSLYKITFQCLSLVYILQRCILPNRAITQPLSGTMITVRTVIEQLMELYFKQYRNFTNWDYRFDFADTIADEVIWTKPTLYEAICDVVEDYNVIPYLTFEKDPLNRDVFMLRFKNVTSATTEYSDEFVNGEEVHGSLENSPQRMINFIENAITPSNIKETNLYEKSDIGLLVDNSPTIAIFSRMKVNKPKKFLFKMNFDYSYYTYLDGGWTKIDITEFVLEKSLYDQLPFKESPSDDDLNTALSCQNMALYYEKDTHVAIGGLRQQDATKWLVWSGNYAITNVINYIFKHRRDLVDGNFNWEERDDYPETYPTVTNNGDHSVKNAIYDIEYQTMDTLRYDIEKDKGYGSLLQNQTGAFISFKSYLKQQQDLMNRLGEEELIIMGRVTDENDLPENGNTYKGRLIVQVTKLGFANYFNFMAIATSQFNRIDGDALINTKKRFWDIIPASESIEREEIITLNSSNNAGNIINLINNGSINHVLLETLTEGGLIIKRVYLPFWAYNLTENSTSNMVVKIKTENNFYAGFKLIKEGSATYSVGVPYVDENNGTFYSSRIHFVGLKTENLEPYVSGINPNITLWFDTYSKSNDLRYKSYPEVTPELEEITTYYGSWIADGFKYKDNRESFSLTIKLDRFQ